MVATNTHRRSRAVQSAVPRADRIACSSHGRALGLIKPAALSGVPPQHCLNDREAKVLDGQLKGKKFVTGDTLTLADFSLGAAMNLAEMARYPVERYSEIKRWFRTLSALPAWQKTLAQAVLRGSFPVHLRGYAVKM
jgi:glutathione S-transferase